MGLGIDIAHGYATLGTIGLRVAFPPPLKGVWIGS